MTDGIRVEIEVDAIEACPIAEASADTDAPIDEVTRSSGRDENGRVAEEFTVEHGSDGDGKARGAAETASELDGAEPVYEFESRTVYRFDRDPGESCVCDCIEGFGCPVADVRAVDGSLIVATHVSDPDRLATVVSELRDRFDDVAVRRVVPSSGTDGQDPRLVDRGQLTDRQREVLETAHEMGYFDYPKGANASEVAAELDVAHSTFSEHLAAAQGKLLTELLDA